VLPIRLPLSYTSNVSPLRKASVTVNVAPSLGATNFQAGAPTNCELPALLGTQPAPAGSAGAQPFAKTPAAPKLNSYQGPPGVTAIAT